MTILLSAAKLAEQALRKIGAFSVNDSGATGSELKIALTWLDLVMAHHFGSERVFFLVPSTLRVPLTAAVKKYNLQTTLGAADYPKNGIQFPVSAMIRDSNGAEDLLAIIPFEKYDAIDNKDFTGTPEEIFIDRLDPPTMFTYPVLAAGQTGWTVELRVQTFAPTTDETKGNEATSLRKAWQLWAITELARWIGDGPIRRLPAATIKMWGGDADKLKTDLLAFENRQHATTSGRVEFRDF